MFGVHFQIFLILYMANIDFLCFSVGQFPQTVSPLM